jgi:hypothetical protein
MSPAELAAAARIQDTATLRTLRANLIKRRTEQRNDIAASDDQAQLRAIDEELQRRLLGAIDNVALDAAFERWLATDTVGAGTARKLISADNKLGLVRHAFALAYQSGRADGAASLQHTMLAAAECPLPLEAFS